MQLTFKKKNVPQNKWRKYQGKINRKSLRLTKQLVTRKPLLNDDKEITMHRIPYKKVILTKR